MFFYLASRLVLIHYIINRTAKLRLFLQIGKKVVSEITFYNNSGRVLYEF